jgi:N-carbamoylputrescine amidase
MDQVEFSRTHWPFLRDRRIDAYDNLTKRFVDEGVPFNTKKTVT